MLKNRLYYAQPDCKQFTTHIKRTDQDVDGKHYVILNESAFYPTGGGQPHDIGTINGVKVVDVVDTNNEIRHYVENPIQTANEVDCVIDWERRLDHMQQHAGQHILSAAFVELYNFPTVSFHLGTSFLTIDIEADHVTNEQLLAVENLANDVILENRPIEVKWLTEEELDQYPIRKKIQADDEIRLVIISDFDYIGCGGTHPTSTGQVGGIKIMSVEKHRGNTRVHFVCGKRVLQQLNNKTAVVKEASQLLSAAEDKVGEAIENLLENNHSLEKSLREVQDELLSFEARDLLNKQQNNVIAKAFKDRSIQDLQKLARFVMAESDETVALLVADNGEKLQFVAARGSSLTTSMRAVSTAVLPEINGKGGGSDALVQGGGEHTLTAEELLSRMEDALIASQPH